MKEEEADACPHQAYRVSEEHRRDEAGPAGRLVGMAVSVWENGAYCDYLAHCTVRQVTRYVCLVTSGHNPNRGPAAEKGRAREEEGGREKEG